MVNKEGASSSKKLFPTNKEIMIEKPVPLMVVAVNNCTKQHDKFERVFRYFDGDGDGKISPDELRSCMRSTVGEELSVEAATYVVESHDSDGDGLLDMEDFLKLVEVDGEEEEKKDLREAFGMYEMDGLGCITPKSLKRMLSRLGEKKTMDECGTMISRFDLDGDGVLSFEEFLAMMV